MSKHDNNVEIKNNRLPQWRKAEACYFVTWRLDLGSGRLNGPERDLVCRAIEYFHGERYKLRAYVVMDNHVHIVLVMLAGNDLSDQLKSIKRYTAIHINRMRGRSGKLWQKASYTRILFDNSAVASCSEYVMSNPQRRWHGISEYKWMKQFD
ncbi:transposase [bacterium]|nr:transposase [bacterium]